MKRIKSKLNNNSDSGYTIIELIIVITIIMAIVAVIGASIANIYKARSGTAAAKIEATLSQSKVNMLSGRKNMMRLEYSDEDECYYAKLFDRLPDGSGYEEDPYESNPLGNKLLKIDVNGSIDLKTTAVEFYFKSGTGKIDKAVIKDTDDSIVTDSTKLTEINVTFGKTYTVTVFANTGAITTAITSD